MRNLISAQLPVVLIGMRIVVWRAWAVELSDLIVGHDCIASGVHFVELIMGLSLIRCYHSPVEQTLICANSPWNRFSKLRGLHRSLSHSLS